MIRETLIRFLKRYDSIIRFILKFFIGVIIFNLINNIGYGRSEFLFITKSAVAIPYVILMGILFAVFSATPIYLLITANLVIQLSASFELAFFILLFCCCVIIFYVRLAFKESMFIIITVLAFYFKMPYIVPLFAGLYYGLTCILPITIGVFVWFSIPVVSELINSSKSTEINIAEIQNSLTEIHLAFLNFITNTSEWIIISFIFAMVLVCVYLVSKISFNYAKEASVVLGSFLCIVSIISSTLVADVNFGFFSTVLFSVLSTAIVLVIRFFDVILDYPSATRVEFSDEDNYYYVKVIPKINTLKQTKNTRKVMRSLEKEE